MHICENLVDQSNIDVLKYIGMKLSVCASAYSSHRNMRINMYKGYILGRYI